MTGGTKASDYENVTLTEEEMNNFFNERALYELAIKSLVGRICTRAIYSRGMDPPDLNRLMKVVLLPICHWLYPQGLAFLYLP